MTSQKIAIGLVAVALFVGSMTAHAADYSVGFEAYQRGYYGTALRIFRQLANQGNANAQNLLGIIYENGRGIPRSYLEAAKWYRKAADQGDANAQYNLGVMYGTGQSVPQDFVLAHMWFNLAAKQGDSTARANRDIVAKRMTVEQIAEAQRLAREWNPKGE